MRKALIVGWVALLPAIAGLAGCGLKAPPALVAAPDFAPAKAVVVEVVENSKRTAAAAGEIAAVYVEHAADTQPASVFIAETSPVVAATTQAAADTVDSAKKLAPAVTKVEKQAAAVVENAKEQHKSAVDSQDALKKEKDSWFGGKIGHLLADALWIGGIALAIWGVSRLLLMFSPATALTSIVSLDTPLHILANILSAAGTIAAAAVGVVVRGVKWLWNEIALAHIPWPAAPVAAIQSTPNVPAVKPAV